MVDDLRLHGVGTNLEQACHVHGDLIVRVRIKITHDLRTVRMCDDKPDCVVNCPAARLGLAPRKNHETAGVVEHCRRWFRVDRYIECCTCVLRYSAHDLDTGGPCGWSGEQ